MDKTRDPVWVAHDIADQNQSAEASVWSTYFDAESSGMATSLVAQFHAIGVVANPDGAPTLVRVEFAPLLAHRIASIGLSHGTYCGRDHGRLSVSRRPSGVRIGTHAQILASPDPALRRWSR